MLPYLKGYFPYLLNNIESMGRSAGKLSFWYKKKNRKYLQKIVFFSKIKRLVFRRFFFFSLKRKFLPSNVFIVMGLRVGKKKLHFKLRRNRKHLIVTKSRYFNERRFTQSGANANYKKTTSKKIPRKVNFQKYCFRKYK